jgi:hypothetical protein
MAGFLAQHSDLCPAGCDKGLDPLKTTEVKTLQIIAEGKGRGRIVRSMNDGRT